MGKLDLKITFILAAVCFVGGLLVVPYQLETLEKTLPKQFEEVMATMPIPFTALLILSALQILLVSFVFAFLGIKMARRTGFLINVLDSLFSEGRININRKGVLYSIIFGIIVGFFIVGVDRFYYQYQIPMINESEPSFSLLGLLAGVLYGGVFEEVLLRLFTMSLLVLIFMKLFKLHKESISGKFYWISIITAATLFATGHLPANELLFGELTTDVIIRCFLLNGIGGVLFGYLYWKKGFEYAVFSHMIAHISMQLIFIPLLY